MAIKTVPINSRLFSPSQNGPNDCIVLRKNDSFDGSSGVIEISFPFHQDTPNFHLGLREAMELRNAIDQLYEIKIIEGSN